MDETRDNHCAGLLLFLNTDSVRSAQDIFLAMWVKLCARNCINKDIDNSPTSGPETAAELVCDIKDEGGTQHSSLIISIRVVLGRTKRVFYVSCVCVYVKCTIHVKKQPIKYGTKWATDQINEREQTNGRKAERKKRQSPTIDLADNDWWCGCCVECHSTVPLMCFWYDAMPLRRQCVLPWKWHGYKFLCCAHVHGASTDFLFWGVGLCALLM